MSLEGALRIALTLDAGEIRRVDITSTRPLQASRIFHGKESATVSALLPRLFSICGTAQACAATHALAAARGRPAAEGDTLAHGLLLLMETAQEHAWRLCIDGAPLRGEAPGFATAAAARALLGRLQRLLFPHGGAEGALPDRSGIGEVIDALEMLLTRDLFGMPPEAWCRRLAEEPRGGAGDASLAARLLKSLDDHALPEVGGVTPAFLPSLDPAALDRLLGGAHAEAFIAAPTLDGTPRETTALARQWTDPALLPTRERYGAGLPTRFTALLLELARVPRRMREWLEGAPPDAALHAASPAPGTGIAQVQAARGRLVHRVELEGDTVVRYQILAPTEWNFHPQGVMAKSLLGCRPRDIAAAKRAAELMVQAIDPCVGFEVTIHA